MENAMADVFSYEEINKVQHDMVSETIKSVKSNGKTNALVGIPAFNEENTSASVVLKAKRYVDEVIVVDDGSSDETARLAEEAGARVLRHEKNRGYGASIKTLIYYARDNDTRPLVLVDADAQHPANKIPLLLEKIFDGEADLTIGSRFMDIDDKKDVPVYRRFGIKLLTKLSANNITYTDAEGKERNITDGQSGFRAFSRKALEKINPKETGMGASAEILMEAKDFGLRVQEVPVSISYEGDTSTETPVRHGLGVIGSIIRYLEAKHSLLSFGVPGLTAFLVGIYMGLRTITIYNEIGIWPVGHVFLSFLLFFGGITAGMTGLILHAIINAHKRGYD
ncbi:MAG: glycosyltransferase family 2 protein [Thermoplasmatota archaeon]